MNSKSNLLKEWGLALVILFLSVVLNFLLNIASFESVYRQSLISKYKFMNKNLKNKIEIDLNYGKPVYRLNTGKYFRELMDRDNNIANLFIASDTGKILYSYRESYVGKHLVNELLTVTGEDFSVVNINHRYFISSVITGEAGVVQCRIFVEFKDQVINDRVARMIRERLAILFFCLGGAVMLLGLLLVINRKLIRLRIKNIILIGLVLITTQVTYTFINTSRFEDNYLEIINEKITFFSECINDEIQFFLKLGLSLDMLKNFDAFLARELAVVPECEQVFIVNKNNIYYYADSSEIKKTINDRNMEDKGQFTGSADKYHIIHEIIYNDQPAGKVVTLVNRELIAGQIRDLFLDAITVLIISLIFSYQILLFPYLKVKHKAGEGEAAEKRIDNDILIRLLSFLFYFAEILPLSFIPLLIANVFHTNISGVLNLSENIILGIPIASYLFGTAVAVLVVGNFPDSVSKKSVFAFSSALLILGAVGAALIKNIWLLILFRLISGIGYGSITINSTALILSKYDKSKVATGFGFWASGYGAASFCAIAIGGVVVFRFGFAAALILSAVFAFLLMLFALLYIRSGGQTEKTGPASGKKRKLGEILNIFTDRDVAANFFLRLVPFHLMYIGIFQFILPLLMSREGISKADIGRVLSLFGLIYVGMPLISKLVDRWQNDKIFLFTGSLIIGGSLLLIELGNSIYMFIILVAGISLGSLIADAAEESFITSTEKAARIGKTRLMTIYNSYERFLMVISPIICSFLVGVFNYRNSIAIIGVFTLVCAVFYFFIAQSHRSSTGDAPKGEKN